MSMFFSQLDINLGNPRAMVRLNEINRLQDDIDRAFPGELGGDARTTLWRLDQVGRNGMRLSVRSKGKPSWTHLPRGFLKGDPVVRDVSALRDQLHEQAQRDEPLHFNVIASIKWLVNITDDHGNTILNAKGYPKEKETAMRSDAERLEWLTKKGIKGGFELLQGPFETRIQRLTRPTIMKPGQKPFKVNRYMFDGALRVTDADAFFDLLATGIGSKKCYGCGMMTVCRSPRLRAMASNR